jgi:predicted MFS family arabinose efflux permease
MPFLPLYLCNIRHIPLPEAGLAFPVMGLAQLTASPVAGRLNDRISPKTMLPGAVSFHAGLASAHQSAVFCDTAASV